MPAIGRIAFRVEGRFWNAYAASKDTMDGAVLIGSILRAAVELPDRKTRFMELMKDIYADMLHTVAGQWPVDWTETPAAAE